MQKIIKVKNMGRLDILNTYKLNTSNTIQEVVAGVITFTVIIAALILAMAALA